jgi:ankyrin repeat protein
LLNDLIRWGQFTPARWLLAHGADPNRAQDTNVTDADGRLTDSGGWTALHQAASRGNVRMVDALLKAGADPARRDAAGRTPFDIAAAQPIKKLLRR